MSRETFSMREVATLLLQLVDASSETDLREMGIDGREYIGQGIHKLYIQRDTLVRLVEGGH